MKKGMLIIAATNAISLIIGLLTNFLLPKYLSVDSYAIVKTYSLYMTYSSFFSLGYVDGLYLEYGGKNFGKLDKRELAGKINLFIILELIFMAGWLMAGAILSSPVLICFGVGLLTNAISGCFRSIFQATGEFKIYGKSLSIEKIFVAATYVVLLFLLRKDAPYLVIMCQVLFPVVSTIIFFHMTFKRRSDILALPTSITASLKKYITVGFVLMISNFSLGILTGIDRWFIKLLMDTAAFAQYSFAVSTESVISVFLAPITTVMYNYFCRADGMGNIRKIKNMTLLWSFIIIAGAFPCKWILMHYLAQYVAANRIIFILFSAQVFLVLIRGIYVNVYKVQRKQNKYFRQVIGSIIVGIVLNGTLYYFFRRMESIAVATLLTTFFWMLLCERDYKESRFNLSELLMIIILMAAFYILGGLDYPWLGLGLYLMIYVAAAYLFMKKEFIEMIRFMKEIFIEHIVHKLMGRGNA